MADRGVGDLALEVVSSLEDTKRMGPLEPPVLG